jgi:hypothetical protein
MLSEDEIQERREHQWRFEIKAKTAFWLVFLLILFSLVFLSFELKEALWRDVEGIKKSLDELDQQIIWRKL